MPKKDPSGSNPRTPDTSQPLSPPSDDPALRERGESEGGSTDDETAARLRLAALEKVRKAKQEGQTPNPAADESIDPKNEVDKKTQ